MADAPTDNKPRVLIVDDERFNLNALHGLLKDEYRTMVATQGEQALQAALANQPDLILLDINMPGMDGYEVCARLKADDRTRTIPVIFITALSDANDETRGLELGAADYIVKPFNLAVVRARVRTQIRLKQQSDLLERFAFIDSLTGLPNRRAFDERSTREWNRCQRSAQPLSLLMMDVDHFKLYNDAYGHAAGDDCLRAVGQAIGAQVQRASDFAARYGGEEFVAVLPQSDLEAATGVAERLREAVSELRREHRASKVAPHVTLSVGAVCVMPSEQVQLAEVLRAADALLYECKAGGRNCVRARRMG